MSTTTDLEHKRGDILVPVPIQTIEKMERQIAALQAEKVELVEALKPFAFIARQEERSDSGTSVMVNVNRCRDARALLTKHGKEVE
jgi:hypothetical protein